MQQNGKYEDHFLKIEKDVGEIKDSLATSINGLTKAVEGLSKELSTFMRVAENSMPIKVVFWVIFFMILGLIGIEGVKQLGPIMGKLFGV